MKKILTALIVLLLFYPIQLSAHPHIFMKGSAIFFVDKKILKGIQVTWIFDNMFSSSVIKDYDRNKDRFFDKNETLRVKDEAFSNLKQYHYFCFINLNEKNIPIKKITNFSVNIIKKKKLVYSFFVPISRRLSSPNGSISLAMYDTTFFCAIDIKNKKSFAVKGLPVKNYSIDCKEKIYSTYKAKTNECILNYRGLN